VNIELREKIALPLTLYSTLFTIGIYALYLQLYAYYILGLSNLLIGLFATIYFSVNAPSSILGGYLFDKYRRGKLLLVTALSILTISNFLTPLYPSGYYLLFIRGLQGFSTAIIVPLVNLLASRIMGIGRGIGIVNTFGSIGFMSGGLIGGIIADLFSYETLFYIGGFITLTSLIILLFSRLEVSEEIPGNRIRLSHIKYIKESIWVIYLAYFIRITASGGIWSLFSLFLFTIGGTNILVGVAHSINTLTQAIVFNKISRYSEGRGVNVFKGGLILSAIVFTVYLFSNNIYEVLPAQVILGFAWVMLYAGANVYILENTPSNIQGTALGLLNMFNSLSWIIGSAINGFISDLYGSYKPYILLGVILTIIGYLIVEVYFRRIHPKE